jgi:uncharacterized protein YprB with RNaseH-like and TPR domain
LLEHTFIHIPGIGAKTEQHLWRSGIHTWENFLQTKKSPLSPARDSFVRQNLEVSLENRNNIRFFLDKLSAADTWRLFDRFKDKAVYLDIETSGLYEGIDEITVIGLYDGVTTKTFVQGINLVEFESEIDRYELIITFNGAQFDLPFIRRQFPNIFLPPAHIDLRFFLKKLGYGGGLKAIEKTFGLHRASAIDGMDGYQAVLLWKAYQWGDKSALERLIQYNTADIVHLKPLMEQGYHEMRDKILSVNDPTPLGGVF